MRCETVALATQAIRCWDGTGVSLAGSPNAHQDRREGGHACSVRDLSDGGSGRAQATVPGDLGAHSKAAPARDGAGMTARTVETTRDGGGGGESLRRPAMKAPPEGVLGGIRACERLDTPSTEQEKCLLISRSAVESRERPTVLVGQRSSGKSRVRTVLYERNSG